MTPSVSPKEEVRQFGKRKGREGKVSLRSGQEGRNSHSGR